MEVAVKKQVAALLAVLAGLVAFGQLIAWQASGSFKTYMVGHDYAIAGALAERGLEDAQISAVFTAANNQAGAARGEGILRSAGYDPGMQTALLLGAQRFYTDTAALMFILCAAAAGGALALFWLHNRRVNKQIEEAESQVRRFMDGDTGMRLQDCGEGVLFRLFAAVNQMATSLSAHGEREKKNKEFLRVMISDISHQLKTPLSALKLYNEIIQNEHTGNRAVEDFTQKSMRELLRMENLILNLLKLARLDADSIELNSKEHPLREFLLDIAQGFAARAELEGKETAVSCGPDIRLRFDDVWLAEAVSNIVKNALDHTKAGGRVELNCEKTPALTEIHIKDNGRGIHPDDIHHIFKRFYRSRFSNDTQGVGIGLTLAKSIIEKHGATVNVLSELGRGTIFIIAFTNLSVL